MPNEDTATPETKLTAMCQRTIQQLDELSEKLDAYCRELLQSRAESPADPGGDVTRTTWCGRSRKPRDGSAWSFCLDLLRSLGCDHGRSNGVKRACCRMPADGRARQDFRRQNILLDIGRTGRGWRLSGAVEPNKSPAIAT